MRMTKAHGLALAAGLLCAAPALAEPVVVTDIPPVHSLVARVMQGIGEPTLTLPPGASPHGYAMRPSEAAALADADVVFWVGPELTPWLDRAIDTLGERAEAVELLEVPGTVHLAFREGATFEAHHHGDEAGHEEHDHDHDEADTAHDEHGDHESHDEAGGHGHEDHAEEHAHEHDHHGTDPHAWLDPENARVWLAAIAETLAATDPDNAAAYRDNAAAGARELDALQASVAETLKPVRGTPFVVFHDAYHYFENRFDIEAAGAVALSDASKPGPARVAEIRETIRHLGATCVFTEPQFRPVLVATLVEGTEARTATLDPIGIDLAPGPDLYPKLLSNLADNLAGCLD